MPGKTREALDGMTIMALPGRHFFTLLVALLSQFFTIDFSVEKWGGCQWVFVFECIVDIGLLVWAIASTMVRMAKKLSDMMSERDAAVAECLNRHYNSAAKV